MNYKILTWMFVLLTLTLSANALLNDSIAYYSFDETTNNLAYGGTPIGVDGKLDGAIDLDGSNDYIDISPSISSLGSNFTISIWINPDTITSDRTNIISLRDNNNVLFSCDDDFAADSCKFEGNDEFAVTLGSWTHIVYVHKTGDTCDVYRNGTKVVDNTPCTTNSAISETDVFGARPDHSNKFDGALDEIAIYSRTLSEAEILSIYQSGSPTETTDEIVSDVSYYSSMDGLYDFSGNANYATDNSATQTDNATGILNSAFDFDGTNDFIESPISLNTSGDFSFGGWVKANNVAGTNEEYFSVGVTATANKNIFLRCETTNNLKMGIVGGSNFIDSNGCPNKWVFLVVTYNSNDGNMSLYYNGTFVGSATDSFTENPSKISIGARVNNDLKMRGLIDEVFFYERLLSQTEITELYNSGTGFNPYASPLIPPPSNTINLETPVNDTYTYNTTNDFKFNVTSNADLLYCKLLIDDIINITRFQGDIQTGSSRSCTGINCSNIYDGNWDTYGDLTGATSYNIRYTKPIENFSWIVKDEIGVHRLNITSIGCLAQTPMRLKIESDGNNMYYTCWDGLSESSVYNSINGGVKLYEEQFQVFNQTNLSSSITQTLPEGDYNWSINCTDIYGNEFASTETNHLVIDSTDPQINLEGLFQNKLAMNKLRGYINFSDDNLYSINISDDVTGAIFNITGITTQTYNYTLNHDVSAYSSGSHILNIRVADGHTAKEIKPYKVKNDWLDNGIKYEFDDGWVSINPEGLTGKLYTKKEKDRYTFEYDKGWFEELDEKTFYVRSSHYIDIRQDSKYAGHLIVPALNKWIDFEEIDGVENVVIERLSDTEIKVIINPKLKGKDKLKFKSVGDLNIIEYNLTWFKVNLTNDIRSEITDSDSQTIRITAEMPGISTYADNFSVNFEYDGSVQSPLTETTSTNELAWNYYIAPDTITTDSEIRNNYINYTISQNGTTEIVNISQNQSVYRLLLAECNATFNTTAINFNIVDETSLVPLVTNLDASVQYEDLNGVITKTANFELSGANNYSWCIAPANTTILATSDGFTYGGGDYDIRQYTFSDLSLSNSTKNVTLYLLNESLITDVILKVVDETDSRVEGVTINIQRFYPGTGEFLTTEIVTTDWNGLAQTGLILDDVYYAFTISVDGYNSTYFEPAQVYTTQLVFKIELESAADSFSDKVGWSITPDSPVLVGNETFDLSTISSSNSIEWYSIESTYDSVTKTSNDTTIAGGTTSVTWNFNDTGYVYNTYTIKVENEDPYSFDVVYVVNDFTPGNDSLMELQPDINNLIPEFWRILFAVFLSLMLAIIMMSLINPEMGGLMALLVQILFSFYGWIPIPFIIVESFIVIGLYILFSRSELS